MKKNTRKIVLILIFEIRGLTNNIGNAIFWQKMQWRSDFNHLKVKDTSSRNSYNLDSV